MPKRPVFAALVGGAALILVIHFKTPEPVPASPAELQPVIVGQGSSPIPGATAATASGSYVGSVISTPYGPVQVQVTLENGRVTAVEAVQMPANDPRSSQISQYAIPQLIQEVLQAQSAQVDAVSGATYTCRAFMQSMQSALSQASG
jgi:uncharacterized protein with FMN-binding domain